MILSTGVYKKAVESLKPIEKVADEKVADDTKEEKQASVFVDKNENFTFYVADICKKIKFTLPGDQSLKDKYSTCNISKEFKEFCSNLVVEIITRIGQMLKTEAELRGIKTVNDSIITIIIKHMHTASGIDSIPTLKFVNDKISEYKKYKKEKKTKSDANAKLEKKDDSNKPAAAPVTKEDKKPVPPTKEDKKPVPPTKEEKKPVSPSPKEESDEEDEEDEEDGSETEEASDVEYDDED
jgi:hypothetical protein